MTPVWKLSPSSAQLPPCTQPVLAWAGAGARRVTAVASAARVDALNRINFFILFPSLVFGFGWGSFGKCREQLFHPQNRLRLERAGTVDYFGRAESDQVIRTK